MAGNQVSKYGQTLTNGKSPKNMISRNPTPLNISNAVVRRASGYSQTTWPILSQFRFVNPKFSKMPFRIGYLARWAPVVVLAAYGYIPYASWYVKNGYLFITGQEPEPIITTDRSRFFNYSY